jgi:hypothetical protein
MHITCLGCTSLIALSALLTVGSIAAWVHHETTTPSATISPARHLPILSLDNGCVAVVRAEGYNATQGAYLPDGRIVALGIPTIDFAKLFGSALQGAGKPNAPVTTALNLTMQRIVLLDHGVATELPIPTSQEHVASVQAFSVDPAGAHLIASVNLLEAGANAYDPGRQGGPSEVWLLDLASRQWTKLLRLPVGQNMRFAAWLPDGSAVLGRPMGQREDTATDMWALDLRGHVRTVARLPGLRVWKLLTDASGVHLLGFTSIGANHGRIFTADLATGKTSERPVIDVPGMHPGPLSPDESLTVVNDSLVALDWKAARLRHLAQLIIEANNLRAAKDGTWAFADLSGPTGAFVRSGVVAINLKDGHVHSVFARGTQTSMMSVLAPAPTGCGFLASTNGYFSSPFTAEKSEVLEVYADTAALANSLTVKSSEPSPAPAPTSGE